MPTSMRVYRTILLFVIASAVLLTHVTGVRGRIRPTRVQPIEYGHVSDFDAEVYDSSMLELRGGVAAWSCCRVCPQNHLLEIDQLFGSTPPPVRRYDDPQPTPGVVKFIEQETEIRTRPTTFLEEAARVAMGDEPNCCNICATGQSPNPQNEAASEIPAGSDGVRREGIRAPFKNLQFSLSRVPLPPCCPYCRENHLNEAFNLVVPPISMRPLPYIAKKDKYSGKPVFLEVENQVDAESESTSRQSAKRVYTYTSPTPDNCCNRCIRPPTETEQAVQAGENLWPEPQTQAQEEDEASGEDAAATEATAEEEAPAEEAAAEEPAAE